MNNFFQFFILGLGPAAIYALLAQGAVLIYRGSGIVNFAHGGMALLGAITFTELQAHGAPVAAAVLAAVAVGAAVGVLTQVFVIGRLRNAAPIVRVISTLGVLIVIEAAATLHYSNQLTTVPQFLPLYFWQVGGVLVQSDRVILFGIAFVLTVALTAVQRRWLPALATSAAAEDEAAAAMLGWSPTNLALANWAAGGALAGAAGALVVPLTGLLVANVVALMVPALAAALLGRFDSFPLAFVGATVIGVAQSEILEFWSQPGASSAVPFFLVAAVLVVTGRGLPLRSHVAERLPSVTSGRIRPIPLVVTLATAISLTLWVFGPNVQDAITVSLSAGCILLSIVLLTGFAGQISLAQYAVAGLGALVAGLLVAKDGVPFWAAAIVGILAAIPFGVLFALPALRTRGVTLAVVTLGLGLGVTAMIFNNLNYTGGVNGTVVGETHLFGLDIAADSYPDRYAVFTIIVFAVAAMVVANIRRSAAGRRLIAIRENERAAAALGISVLGAKTYAFAAAAAIATLGGILIGFRAPTIGFDQFDPSFSLYAVGYAVIGGLGYACGPLVGSLLVAGGIGNLLDNALSGIGQYLTLIGGCMVLLTLLANPDGVVPNFVGQLRFVGKRARRLPFASKLEAALGLLAAPRRPKKPAMVSLPGGVDGASLATAPPRRGERKALTVDNITVRYGGVVAVDSVSLAVKPGEIVGLIGPNGAGKTTLIDAVTGFARISSGSIRLGETNISRKRVSARVKAGVGRSWQSLELFEDVTIRENMLIAGDDIPWWKGLTAAVYPGSRDLNAASEAAVAYFDLAEDLDRYPGELSYGRRRLVGVARTVALNPSVLLLDEPAAGLSDVESKELGALVTRLAKSWEMAVLLVEHDVDLVMSICDRVVVLDFGKMIAAGAPDAIRTDPAVVAAYLGEAEELAATDIAL